MANVQIDGLPKGVTIVQGYFVWSGFDEEGRRVSGGGEYPFSEDPDAKLDYDGLKTIGMLTVAREQLLRMELEGEDLKEDG
ncbi:MAG: hypothetical protein M3R38_22155 [Actinomycetota bacterium]|nr:hypothetical protein [Actinomycetota bacterium]